MQQSVREPTIRPYPGTRPMALLVLAFGVAIGGALAGTPVRAIDPPDLAPATVPSGTLAGLADVVRKPVRMIPLPVRDEPQTAGH
ncbi:hypothetical protein [Methylobacterium thuringiense]|uniref:Serine protease n=1 Tax=Methylobacterium thuringiense TaxID=1003091 RepID=A0ABQ4TMA7_9HYPH|nr:hypothetical protein [Methylobacterium thuringiense]GJE54953.1 hypothetical protein EKPJFOCH_1439 [Methylobacterium thuringiense]